MLLGFERERAARRGQTQARLWGPPACALKPRSQNLLERGLQVNAWPMLLPPLSHLLLPPPLPCAVQLQRGGPVLPGQQLEHGGLRYRAVDPARQPAQALQVRSAAFTGCAPWAVSQ